jgi:DNA-binding GntR family transcriptional regulator
MDSGPSTEASRHLAPVQRWGLQALERRSTTENVLAELRSAIISGRIGPLEPLREVALSDALGTGRSAIREAIRQLVQEGLVEYRLNRGAFVRAITEEEAYDVYLAREAIEVAAVAHAFERPVTLDLNPLEARLRQIIRAAADTPDRQPAGTELVTADLDFHREMVRLSGSQRLTRAHETLAAEAQMLMHHQPVYPLTDYAGDHRILFDAIAERDPDTLEKIREHLRLSAQLIAGEIHRIATRRSAPETV